MTPMPLDYLEMASCSERGDVRPTNEDAVEIDPREGFCILADGMGGTDAGGVASAMLVDRLGALLRRLPDAGPEERCLALRDEIRAVDGDLCRLSEEKGYRRGCGSTLVVLLLDKERPGGAVCLSIGDSRLYRYRSHVLERITVDHTIASESGISETELPAVYQGMLTRAVGFGTGAEPDRFDLRLRSGDVYLLCSDGLTRVFPDNQLRGIVNFLRNHSAGNLAKILVGCVLDCGAPDNVSVAVLKIGSLPDPGLQTRPDDVRDARERRCRSQWGSRIVCK